MIKEPNNIQPFDILENSNIDLTDIAPTEIPKTFKPTFYLENRIYENLQFKQTVGQQK